jgi:hypothetical protein
MCEHRILAAFRDSGANTIVANRLVEPTNYRAERSAGASHEVLKKNIATSRCEGIPREPDK